MKLLVLCEECNEYNVIESDNVGRSVIHSNLRNEIEVAWDVANTGDLEEMAEISEGDVEVTNIRITFLCTNCRQDSITVEMD
ncbi:hypothetical protein M655_024885 [Brevibacillus sp. NSP2.1]|uniref:hypothetical protein n=1 Tax=Brevibacillus sp. NSP2.1 TaxID=3003229 RepID=UPI00047ED600|nr:hypothetical protein [Brevibacillus sp. NSP2.1]QHZ58609.1 hypothetical protein M655_024885 [Brevibacillus sp. NSP2.1]